MNQFSFLQHFKIISWHYFILFYFYCCKNILFIVANNNGVPRSKNTKPLGIYRSRSHILPYNIHMICGRTFLSMFNYIPNVLSSRFLSHCCFILVVVLVVFLRIVTEFSVVLLSFLHFIVSFLILLL